MNPIKILHRWSGAVLFEAAVSTLRECVLKAIADKANLCGANLRGANLRDADLRGANLCDADLCGANLCDADLRDANLRGANLRGANLCDANLRDANLRDANLCDADLCGANLRGANLCGAKEISKLAAAQTLIVPQDGDVTGWKMCRNGVLVKLLIPDGAKRHNASFRKCRAELARVIEIIGGERAVSIYDESFVYEIGQTVTPAEHSPYDPNRWNECSGGIHFFITREEAESYQ